MKKRTISILMMVIAVLVMSTCAIVFVGCSKDIKLTYDLGYENNTRTDNIKSNKSVNLFTPNREDYEFLYWTDSNGAKLDTVAKFKEDTTIKAVWGVEIEYHIGEDKVFTEVIIEGTTLSTSSNYVVSDESRDVVGYYTVDAEGDYINDVTNAKITHKTAVQVAEMTKGLEIVNGVVIKYTGSAEKVVVPAIYQGEKVTSIGNYMRDISATSTEITGAFEPLLNDNNEYYPRVTNVSLPITITRVEKQAFKNMIYLEEMYFPKNIETFDNGVMANLTGKEMALTTVRFAPDCKLTDTGESAFGEQNKLITVELPDGIEVIGDSAFLGCRSLKTLDLKNATTIRRGAFVGCNGFKEFYIPSSVTTIEVQSKSSQDRGMGLFQNRDSTAGVLTVHVAQKSSLSGFAEGWDRFNYNVPKGGQHYVLFSARTVKIAYLSPVGEEKIYNFNDVHLQIAGYRTRTVVPESFVTSDTTKKYYGLKLQGTETTVINVIINSVGQYDISKMDIINNPASIFEVVYEEDLP